MSHASPTSYERPTLVGSLEPDAVRSGVRRGPYGLFQRRVRPGVFGEPRFEQELVDEQRCAHRPHRIAWDAWRRMTAAAADAGLDGARLQIHSAYRSIAWQRHVFDYWVEERRRRRADEGLAPVSRAELERAQQKWTARPGRSAHHTGLALDLGLYGLGAVAGRRAEEYAWLAAHAIRFGFYPYLPEPWHWEYNPPGLVEQLRELRRALSAGEEVTGLLTAPKIIPVAEPSVRRRRKRSQAP